MKRAFALAAFLCLFSSSAMADCPGHESTSASTPVPPTDQQASSGATTTATDDSTVLAVHTDRPTETVPEQQ